MDYFFFGMSNGTVHYCHSMETGMHLADLNQVRHLFLYYMYYALHLDFFFGLCLGEDVYAGCYLI